MSIKSSALVSDPADPASVAFQAVASPRAKRLASKLLNLAKITLHILLMRFVMDQFKPAVFLVVEAVPVW